MKFEQHYSSSMGNLYTVTAVNGRRLLLECGVRWPVLLAALHYDLDGIDGCLLTHEHQDHSKSVSEVMRAGINVYASAGTFGVIDSRRALVVMGKVCFDVGNSFEVISFPIIHDAADPHGYIVHEIDTEEYLFFVPDSSHIKQRFNIKFSIIAIDCSYDLKILEHRVDTQDINEALAKRLLMSHMEKQVAMKYLAEFCDLSKCRQINLLHMSSDNIDKQATKKDFEKMFFIETVIK